MNSRRYDLDWVRIIAFAFLIFYHIGMFYVTWDWHVKSTYSSEASEWLMSLVNPWRLGILFLISGISIRFMADKYALGPLAISRSVRLLVPIIFGVVLIVMPQAWLQLIARGEITDGFLAFWPKYLDPSSSYSIITPTWNHLWYIVYLLPYTLICLLVAKPVSAFMTGSGQKITQRLFGEKFGVLWVFIVPFTPHLIFRIFLDPYFPTTHDLVNDWANHAHNFTTLFMGFLLAKDTAFWKAINRAFVPSIVTAITLGIILSYIWSQWDMFSAASSPHGWALWPARIGRVAYAWICMIVILGAAQRWLNRPSRALTYMTEAIFPWYILHQTIIIMAGFWLTRQSLGAPTEIGLVIFITISGCALIHELLIRRISILRPLFGLKWEKASF